MAGENVDPRFQPGFQPQDLTSNHETQAGNERDNEQDSGVDAGLMVFWDEPADQDPANPINWSARRRWSIVAMVSFITFLT